VLLNKTIGYTALLGLLGVILFATFPVQIATLFTGKDLLSAPAVLGKIALTMFLLSFANIFLLFGAARVVGKKRNVCLLGVFLVSFWLLEAGGLYYGSSSLPEFVTLFLGIATIFTLASYIFMRCILKSEKNDGVNKSIIKEN